MNANIPGNGIVVFRWVIAYILQRTQLASEVYCVLHPKTNIANLNGNQKRELNTINGYIEKFLEILLEGNAFLRFKQIHSTILRKKYERYDEINEILAKLKYIKIKHDAITPWKAEKRDIKTKTNEFKPCKKLFKRKPINAFQQILTDTEIDQLIQEYDQQLASSSDLSEIKNDIDAYIANVLRTQITINVHDVLLEYTGQELDIIHFKRILSDCQKINSGIINQRRSKVVNRLYNTTTNIEKEIRKHIRLKDGSKFVGVDFNAMHLFILIGEMARRGFRDEGMQGYLDDGLYKLIEKVSDDPKITEKRVKKAVMPMLYDDESYSYPDFLRNFFKVAAPKLHHFLEKFRGKEFSHIMMKAEADFVVDRIGKKIMQQGISFFTVHDCIYIKAGHEDWLANLIEQESLDYYKLKPKLRFEGVVR
jgi:hypothetical protein